jgi:chaperone modulatory protein CbpM
MSDPSEPRVSAELIDATTLCTLDEICLACNVDHNWIAELIEHGAIEPIGQTRSDWHFTSVTIVRIAKARRLERDLGLNSPGVALALDLLDQIDDLRAQLRVARGPSTHDAQ